MKKFIITAVLCAASIFAKAQTILYAQEGQKVRVAIVEQTAIYTASGNNLKEAIATAEERQKNKQAVYRSHNRNQNLINYAYCTTGVFGDIERNIYIYKSKK